MTEKQINTINRISYVIASILVAAIVFLLASLIVSAVRFTYKAVNNAITKFDDKTEIERLGKQNEQFRTWETYTPSGLEAFNFEGHKYITAYRSGMCHAETCPCKTNNVVIQLGGVEAPQLYTEPQVVPLSEIENRRGN